jgi:hypothetical protein
VQGEAILIVEETAVHLNACSPLERYGAWLPGFVVAVIREPRFRLGVMSAVFKGLAPPLKRDAAWLHGIPAGSNSGG